MTTMQLIGDTAGEPTARKQFRHRRRGDVVLDPNPKLSAELRQKYLEPIVPWTMYAVELSPSAGTVYGLVSALDMIGYAAHFECGVPWYASQGAWIKSLAPPSRSDPVHYTDGRRACRQMVRPELRHVVVERPRKPAIALLDRMELRQKYEAIVRRYLSPGVLAALAS